MEIELANRLAVLGHPQRLAVFRLLMRRNPDEVAAGDIGSALNLRPSTLSSYLAALMQAGLVVQTRRGTRLHYSINAQNVSRTLDDLFLDCCRGRPEMCSFLPVKSKGETVIMAHPKFNVLFICTGNSARSIFAESILRSVAGDRFNAYSAGTYPSSEVNGNALQVLRDKGHDVSQLRSKNVSEFQTEDAPEFDFVFTVCDQAANEECPIWGARPISAHWGMPDPVQTEGTDAQKSLAFQQAYGILKNRIAAFAALPLRELDRVSLQRAADDIARQSETA
ncbi:helix-turn-helix domain-containing protein [Rhodobacteraceae bacterium F11138]|nr:helix-turn-helix domain-containing protein [Rhodobacteraceae bacterium F11138]